jgi:predicted PurR-regulated permease PerM
MADQTGQDVYLRVPFTTLLKIALFILLALIAVKLAPVLGVVYVAIMLAVVMAAAVNWLEKHHVRRGIALTIVAALIFGALLGFLFGVVPTMFSELRDLVKEAPKLAASLEKRFPAATPYIRSISAQFTSPPGKNSESLLSRGAMAGWYAIEAVTTILMTVVMAVYFVVEGKRALAWLFSFAPEEQRKKLVRTADEIEPVMLAYMRGQLITSTLSAGAALAALIPYHVPAAAPLAVLSFVGDFVPVIGFIVSIVPAVLLALLVSPAAATAVVIAYVGYQLLENYIISPKVYGSALKLSTLTVLLSIIVGGVLAGPLGAILILPLAAAYSPIERIWLRHKLAPDTIRKHDAIEGDDPERAERVTEDVMQSR